MPANLMFSTAAEIKAFRQKHNMNQHEFWSRVGVTQSGGSRYESGRKMPNAVQSLLHLTYAPENRANKLLTELRGWAQKKATSTSGTT
jgi:DNA-binding transcriptional regulator YiaG